MTHSAYIERRVRVLGWTMRLQCLTILLLLGMGSVALACGLKRTAQADGLLTLLNITILALNAHLRRKWKTLHPDAKDLDQVEELKRIHSLPSPGSQRYTINGLYDNSD
jgi:hypothetical protein